MKLQFAQVRQGLWLALTSLCAMSLALILGIEHPLWAAMPVWAMSQPTRGLLLERGLFRLLGTILGAVIGLGILGLQVDKFSTLLLLSLAVLLITPLIATLRAMLSYVPMMAGLTICIVCIPSLVHSGNGIAMAEARVACTLIGVITGLVFGYFLTPAAAISDFAKSVDELAKRTKCIAAGRPSHCFVLAHLLVRYLLAGHSAPPYAIHQETTVSLASGPSRLQAQPAKLVVAYRSG